ncbi:hypothetical protein JCM8097_006686 [Rhodosporidiobolus ruineniae]
MASQAFNDEFTHSHGGSCFFVTVDPAFDDQASFTPPTKLTTDPAHPQIAEAASVVARTRPEADRQQFTSSLVDQAKAALPPTPEPTGAEDEDDEPLKAKDTPETLGQKRDVVNSLLATLKQADGGKVDFQSDREFEGWSNLVLSLVLSLVASQDADLSSAVDTLTSTYTAPHSSSSPAAPPSLPARYTALTTLFNALSTSAVDSKLAVLTRLVAFAAANDDVAVLAPVLSALPAVFAALADGLSAQKRDATVLAIVRALVGRGAASEARKVAEAHLRAVAAAGEKTPEQGQLADAVVALSLAAADVYDLSRLSSLSPATASLGQLVAIFLNGDVAAFSSFDFGAVAEAVEGVSLDKDQLEKKLKLVKLAELCSERVGETVAYEEIREVLQLAKAGEDDGEEVETWVIDAIRASLLSGRLSQPTQSLSVTRALPPTSSASGQLDAKYWHLIEQRLKGWKASLSRVAETTGRAAGVASGREGRREGEDAKKEEE